MGPILERHAMTSELGSLVETLLPAPAPLCPPKPRYPPRPPPRKPTPQDLGTESRAFSRVGAGRRGVVAVAQLRVVPAAVTRKPIGGWVGTCTSAGAPSWEGISPAIGKRAAHGHIESRATFHGGVREKEKSSTAHYGSPNPGYLNFEYM